LWLLKLILKVGLLLQVSCLHRFCLVESEKVKRSTLLVLSWRCLIIQAEAAKNIHWCCDLSLRLLDLIECLRWLGLNRRAEVSESIEIRLLLDLWRKIQTTKHAHLWLILECLLWSWLHETKT